MRKKLTKFLAPFCGCPVLFFVMVEGGFGFCTYLPFELLLSGIMCWTLSLFHKRSVSLNLQVAYTNMQSTDLNFELSGGHWRMGLIRRFPCTVFNSSLFYFLLIKYLLFDV